MITDIHLENFRSYRNESFEFSRGINIIVGPNASGKTNLLEAILFVSRGDTYRTHNINEIINTSSETARLEAHGDNNEIRIAYLRCQADAASKQFKINDQNYQRLSFLKRLPVVVFEPNNVLILTGSPELRRNFLDDLLEQLKPGLCKFAAAIQAGSRSTQQFITARRCSCQSAIVRLEHPSK